MQIGFLGFLFLIFLILKLTNTVSWSWLWIAAPLWIGVAFHLIVFTFIVIVYFLSENK